jgi:VanZ family protein
MKNFLINYWKSIVVFIAIFVLSVVPFRSVPNIANFKNSDKLVHISMYLVLSFALYYDLVHRPSNVGKKYNQNLWLTVFITAFYGGFIEIIQGAFFAPRTCDIRDWAADLIGIAVGLLIACVLPIDSSKKEQTNGEI